MRPLVVISDVHGRKSLAGIHKIALAAEKERFDKEEIVSPYDYTYDCKYFWECRRNICRCMHGGSASVVMKAGNGICRLAGGAADGVF